MPKKGRYQNRIELLQGTLDVLILQTLQWGPAHGYAISQAIRSNSGDVLQLDTGSLYPALHRMKRQGWIAAEWKISENKQRTLVYRLSRQERSNWHLSARTGRRSWTRWRRHNRTGESEV